MQENSKEYVMYESFDELPEELKEKFKSASKGKFIIAVKDKYVDFINLLTQQGDELVGEYIKNSVKTQVKFGKCGHVANIAPDVYKRGRECGVCKGKQVQQGVNDLATTHQSLIKEWHPTKNGELTPYNVTQGSGKKVWWECEYGHEWETTINGRKDRGCPYCSNQKVLKGYNDIATTHPQYIKYFVNEENAYTHTYRSGKSVELKCPNCDYVKSLRVADLTRQGFSCDMCSDGVSYPEKLLGSILNKLGIKFIKQMSYEGKHRYDFFLPNHNTILESHGGQHYKWHGRGRSIEEEQANDKYKRETAIANGVLENNYHEIDCRESTLDWCRPNIERALTQYVDINSLTDEDWIEADIQAQKSLKIEVCKYWKENKGVDNKLTTQQVAIAFGISTTTVKNYLRWGNTNGFCIYNGQEEARAKNERVSKYVYLIKIDGDKWFERAMSINELSTTTGITRRTIANNLNKEALKYFPYSKYDPKYIGSRIVSAEVYDNQHQTNQNT